ncbi:hypothetical protein EDD17DRAFT_1627869, partial [Pisolithus thermaeus]
MDSSLAALTTWMSSALRTALLPSISAPYIEYSAAIVSRYSKFEISGRHRSSLNSRARPPGRLDIALRITIFANLVPMGTTLPVTDNVKQVYAQLD